MKSTVFHACVALFLLGFTSEVACAQAGAEPVPAAPASAPASVTTDTPQAAPSDTAAPATSDVAPSVAPIAPAYTPPPPEPLAPEGSIKDASDKRRPMSLSAMAFVPWWYGIGIGGSVAFEIPIVHNGFIPKINDSFSIEPSFSFAYTTWRNTYRAYDHDYGLMFRPAVAALWSFYFSPKLRAYAELNIGYTRVNRSYDSASRGYSYGYNYFYGELNVGVFYNFSSRVALRGELGFYGLRAGVAFML
jgi:hypothetical protein